MINPFDHTDLATKFLLGIGAPLASLFLNLSPGEINPWLQTCTYLAALLVSALSAISIISKNLK